MTDLEWPLTDEQVTQLHLILLSIEDEDSFSDEDTQSEFLDFGLDLDQARTLRNFVLKDDISEMARKLGYLTFIDELASSFSDDLANVFSTQMDPAAISGTMRSILTNDVAKIAWHFRETIDSYFENKKALSKKFPDLVSQIYQDALQELKYESEDYVESWRSEGGVVRVVSRLPQLASEALDVIQSFDSK